MTISLDLNGLELVKISASEKDEYLWDEAGNSFPGRQLIDADSFRVHFHELIAKWRDFYGNMQGRGVKLIVSPQLMAAVQRMRKHQNRGDFRFTLETLTDRLKEVGFIRELKDFQLENVCKLARRYQGATFSVPGAGKTTEALAYFFSTASAADKLLVISPLNAFGAWDEQLAACMGDDRLSFVRLTGGADNVKSLLREDHRFMLINYEAFRSQAINEPIRVFLATHDVYVFLDESHKIKNGRSAQAESIRAIQCYPKSKLIMSGTPMPQSPRDLITQYNFLFPDQLVTELNVVDCFKDVYVRTTADRLGITEIRWLRKNIELGTVERELYRRMRQIVVGETAGLRNANTATYLRGLGRCVMRLMAFVSNPSLVAEHFAAVMPELPGYLRRSDGPKIAYVCKRARELAAQGRKILIWSCFVRNVELIAQRLQDIGADFIHGGVPAGSPDDFTTREGKIKRFHDPDNRMMVLVANPAAASEGISLHKACQYAIYLDRSFNAAHFLQSQDRIHRLGLPEGTRPEIELVTCPGSIDDVVDVRLDVKIRTMAQALNDQSIVPTDPELLYDDEDEGDQSDDETKSGISQADVEAILAHLRGC